MSSLSKWSTVFFILMAISSLSLIMVKPVNAQSMPKPSVPQITVTLVDHSYDTPPTTPTYTIDPFTGEQKQVTSGAPSYHVEKKSLEITIKNQPFTPYNDSSGNYVSLCYNIRWKGHYGADWYYDPFQLDGQSSQVYGGWDMTYLTPYTASDSENTIVTYPIAKSGTSGIPDYGQVDFQVQAQIGYIQSEGNAFDQRVFGIHYNFTGESSDWSSTQTVTMSEGSVSISPNPTASPTAIASQNPTSTSTLTPSPPSDRNAPHLEPIDYLMPVSIIVAVVLAAGLLVYHKKHKIKTA